jgi:ADP-ribosylglycohydrolase
MAGLARLYVSYDQDRDWLMAYEFGRVDDAQPPEAWLVVTDDFRFLHDAPEGRVVGFKVTDFSGFDAEHIEVEEIWGDPRFDAPVLGLRSASAGEIVLAARAFFVGRSSLNRDLFTAAAQLDGRDAVEAWRRCLESGDAMAHFGLGYTLFELGEAAEAYRHLRYYTEIAPNGAWNWCWYGRAAEAVAETSEARRAYRRAVELTAAGGQATDAGERLALLPERLALAPQTAMQPPAARVLLWGDALPEIGRRRVDGLSARCAAGLTAGAKEKSYGHTDPNEDAVALVEADGLTLVVCADGHNGMASTRAAVELVLECLEPIPAPEAISDEDLIDMWLAANERATSAATHAGQPESRTTLIVAVVAAGRVRWAAMGDSLLAIVHDDGSLRFLSQPRSHFVGWPMNHGEVAERLCRGTEMLPAAAWVIAATDGLTDFVPGLSQTLARAGSSQASPSRVVERLIDAACAGGAGDNVAVAAVRARGAVEGAEVSRPDVRARIRGCLIGGAVGDALGAPVEFDSIERIRRRFGSQGITDYEMAYGRRGAITDDTQMSLFTAEGLLRAYVRGATKGLCHPPSVVDHAYARWLATQGESSSRWDSTNFDGWLLTNRGLHNTRAPGNTCLSALRASRMGTIDDPLNDSKGCGAVMRAAPVGLLGGDFPGDRFELGCEIGALTHGHPSGYLAAGAMAEIITALVWSDATLPEALDRAALRLRRMPGHEETLQGLEDARALAASDIEPSADAVELLGEGWVAEEALAIGVYCALVARGFEHAVLLAVNHSGDSDSAGAIAGNIFGSLRGYDEIPAQWTYDLELNEVIEPLCRDWNAAFTADPEFAPDPEEWWERYPGW